MITVRELNNRKSDLKNAGKKANALEVVKLNAWYGKTMAVNSISMSIRSRAITALIGPSGCGKSTFIRCLNRMHEVSGGGTIGRRGE